MEGSEQLHMSRLSGWSKLRILGIAALQLEPHIKSIRLAEFRVRYVGVSGAILAASAGQIPGFPQVRLD
jgi:hypothetical protein